MAQVLLIDDSKLIARLVEQALGRKKISLIHIASIADLFGFRGRPSMLSTINPDAILLDIMMPEMDGLDVLRKLKTRTDTKNIPVIMLSANASSRNVSESFNLGAVGFIAKPVKEEILVEELLKAAQRVDCQALIGPLTGDMGSLRHAEEEHEEMKAGLVDLNYLYEILDGDLLMMVELIEAFFEHVDSQLAAIGSAIQKGDPDALKRTAHSLKGAIGNFAVTKLTDLAYTLEKKGIDEDMSDLEPLFDNLAKDCNRLVEALKLWIEQQAN